MITSKFIRKVIVATTIPFMAACSSSHERATFLVPDSNTSVTIERLSTHAYLAGYKRTVVIETESRPIVQLEMFPDTGGYSRANLFRLDSQKLLLRDAANSYTIDLVNRTISKDESRREAGTFLGSFDIDHSKIWRFLPVREKPEMPTEFSGR